MIVSVLIPEEQTMKITSVLVIGLTVRGIPAT